MLRWLRRNRDTGTGEHPALQVIDGDGPEPAPTRTWHERAVQAVGLVAMTAPVFTTEDVWDMLDGHDATVDRRAMGGVMSTALLRGYCHPTEAIRGGRRIWKSLIHEG